MLFRLYDLILPEESFQRHDSLDYYIYWLGVWKQLSQPGVEQVCIAWNDFQIDYRIIDCYIGIESN